MSAETLWISHCELIQHLAQQAKNPKLAKSLRQSFEADLHRITHEYEDFIMTQHLFCMRCMRDRVQSAFWWWRKNNPRQMRAVLWEAEQWYRQALDYLHAC